MRPGISTRVHYESMIRQGGRLGRDKVQKFDDRILQTVYKHWSTQRESIGSCLIRANWVKYDAQWKEPGALFQERPDPVNDSQTGYGTRYKTRSMANLKTFETSYQQMRGVFQQSVNAMQICYEMILRERAKHKLDILARVEFEQ